MCVAGHVLSGREKYYTGSTTQDKEAVSCWEGVVGVCFRDAVVAFIASPRIMRGREWRGVCIPTQKRLLLIVCLTTPSTSRVPIATSGDS